MAIDVVAPQNPLTEYAVDIRSDATHFSGIESFDRLYNTLHQVIGIWTNQEISTSYMVIGQDKLGENKQPFTFQAVPYQKTTNWAARFFQQLKVLYRFTFGGLTSPQDFEAFYANESSPITPASHSKEDCPFCTLSNIERQRVYEGDLVNVLYNYAPLPLGKEKLHFLVIPKDHKRDFTDLTKEEHQEALKVSQLVINRLQENSDLRNLYLYHKTGKDAGQTVEHWHMHIVATHSTFQDVWGKLIVLRNMIFGTLFSFKLSDQELSEKVTKYKEMFKDLKVTDQVSQ